jgi:hypothetical protein
MFLDHSWVPSAFVTLLVIVILAVMNFFERRTRIRVYQAASILIGAFAIYQLYANLSAGVGFITSAAYLCVGIVAVVTCGKVATIERQRIIEESLVLQKDVDRPPIQTSNEQKEADSLLVNQEKAAEELATIRDIENKIAKKSAKLQQEQNATNEDVLEWFNEQIVYFESGIQLALRNCAKLFVQTGKIEIKQEELPPYNRDYTQLQIILISSIFILTERSRMQCVDFVLKVFANYFHNPDPTDIKRKIKGVDTMMMEIKRFLDRP